MQCQQELERYLQQEGVAYQIQHHPVAFTAQQIAESEHVSGKKVVKSVIVLVDGAMILLALPASLRVDLEEVQTYFSAQEVRLAREDEFASRFPNCDVGTMPPFGNLYSLPVYVDEHLTSQETIVFPVGTHTETMSLKYADFERLVHPTIISFALSSVRVG